MTIDLSGINNPQQDSVSDLLKRQGNPRAIYAGLDYGVGQSPDFGLGYSRGLRHGIAWALGIEAVIAGLVVLIVKVV